MSKKRGNRNTNSVKRSLKRKRSGISRQDYRSGGRVRQFGGGGNGGFKVPKDTGPKEGTVKTTNGKTYIWIGGTWVLQQDSGDTGTGDTEANGDVDADTDTDVDVDVDTDTDVDVDADTDVDVDADADDEGQDEEPSIFDDVDENGVPVKNENETNAAFMARLATWQETQTVGDDLDLSNVVRYGEDTIVDPAERKKRIARTTTTAELAAQGIFPTTEAVYDEEGNLISEGEQPTKIPTPEELDTEDMEGKVVEIGQPDYEAFAADVTQREHGEIAYSYDKVTGQMMSTNEQGVQTFHGTPEEFAAEKEVNLEGYKKAPEGTVTAEEDIQELTPYEAIPLPDGVTPEDMKIAQGKVREAIPREDINPATYAAHLAEELNNIEAAQGRPRKWEVAYAFL